MSSRICILNIFTTLCACKGDGWILDNNDTWIRCTLHGKNIPHPEDDSVSRHERNNAIRKTHRELYKQAREDAYKMVDYPFEFEAVCVTVLRRVPNDSYEWLDAANTVVRLIQDNKKEGLDPLNMNRL